jgi:hypothetical protein
MLASERYSTRMYYRMEDEFGKEARCSGEHVVFEMMCDVVGMIVQS